MTQRKAPAAKVSSRPTTSLATSEGRVLIIQDLSPIEEFRLNSVLGAQDAANPMTQLHATMAAMVREIDGTPWPMPTTRPQLEQAIERLDRDGMAALGEYFSTKAEAEAAGNILEDAGN